MGICTEVSGVMKRWAVLASVLVVLAASVAASATSTSLFGARFKVGTEIQFRVQDETTWWWGCCACTPSQILGWRVASPSGTVVFSIIHDAPIPAAAWVGTWNQLNPSGQAVPAGQYVLYVDTTVGTVSRCFTIYDPCGCTSCWSPCWTCGCQEVPTVQNCACRTTLVFVDTPCTNGCLSLFGLFGCSSCCGGCGQP